MEGVCGHSLSCFLSVTLKREIEMNTVKRTFSEIRVGDSIVTARKVTAIKACDGFVLVAFEDPTEWHQFSGLVDTLDIPPKYTVESEVIEPGKTCWYVIEDGDEAIWEHGGPKEFDSKEEAQRHADKLNIEGREESTNKPYGLQAGLSENDIPDVWGIGHASIE